MAKWMAVAVFVVVMAATVSFQVSAQQNADELFVTSAGSGNGAIPWEFRQELGVQVR